MASKATVLVAIPVLARPHRVGPLLGSLYASVREGEVWPVFVCSPGDAEEIEAVKAAEADMIIVPWDPGIGDYWMKANTALRRAAAEGYEWFFQGADDLRFHEGWLPACIAMHERTGACIIGTNDLVNQRVKIGVHSTHSLVHTDYLECGTIDEPDGRKVFHEEYGHWFGDDEFCQTAIWRETFAAAPHAVVEHEHPIYRGGEMDATYARGQATVQQDQALYFSRRHLWGKVYPSG